MGAITVLANSLDLALSKDGRLKIGETKLPDGKDDSQRKSPGHRDRVLSRMERLFPQWFLDIADVAYSARGLGWKFGQGVHIPKENRPLERGPFLRATAVTTFVHWCLLDFVLSILPFLPGIGTPPGGSIYYEQLSPVPRHLVAFTLTVLSGGVAIVSSLRMEYGVITLFAVGILGHSSSAWPPLFDNPWMSTSIHEFWGKRWHQGLRRAFLVLGGYPGEWIAGKVGLVCGAFLASGLYHELSMYLVHRGVDHRVTFFYSFQAIGIILEKVFVKITGRKVVGPFGWCWTFLFVAGTAQFCSTFVFSIFYLSQTYHPSF